VVKSLTPKTLPEALEFRKHQRLIPLAGGTDLMVRKRSWAGTLPKFEYPALFIGGLAELKGINVKDGILTIGAAATLASILEHPAVPDIVKQAISIMASPAIRNAGTLAGNICNASPAADTLPPLYVLGTVLILQSTAAQRELPIAEFIKGPGQTNLQTDELLVAVQIPIQSYDVSFYKKVAARKADALSKVSFAGLAKVSGDMVTDLRMAIGAVAPRVVRSKEAEQLLKGRKIRDLAGLIPELKKIYDPLIRPIDDQRSDAVYRSQVAHRLIEYYIMQCASATAHAK
jgi:xanthine dehydrogenase FAD-binding subunit